MTRTQGEFERRLERLRQIVERLEQADLPLEEGVALYKEGLQLAQACRQELDRARHEITMYQDGVLMEFEPREGGDGSVGD
ncbi:exodeoxyribonuclease VII small subunit [Desulfocurvibacter africanus]|uniref:Exodeoxyribonuclease 7 small subunit n=1 Tax=Desulfocurvibacter africanus subsp. africanus str. Walvis Bay TaxID=690850 RepID=F3Z261_DESAF|nr:exodeoxyribonuclease VII small subunit [Desulfocurvibacter africanus]EGJ51270.1 Exodeoxyribonuclease 7 small subunit [Desulfocurvibacter africanus subsp. africanus str. Walvis Bay]